MPSPRPAVSILMPVRDAQEHVTAAIESVLAQTFPNWELIVVDDGSVDRTPAIVAEFARRDPRIRIHPIAASGIGEALIAGCAACGAGFIARMDADDWMHPDRLQLQHDFLQANPSIGLVSCRVAYGGSSAGYAEHVNWVNSLMSHEQMALRRFVEAPVAHPSVMFRRELPARHGGYQAGAFPEDYELWLRWLEAGVRFGKVTQTLLTWNDPPRRLSRSDPRYSVGAFYTMKGLFLARWLRSNVPPQRALWLWGAGRSTRRRFEPLEAGGARIAGFIDVDAAKQGRRSDGCLVRMADDLPARDQSFILAGVAARGAREQIAEYLTVRGWMEGQDFLLAA